MIDACDACLRRSFLLAHLAPRIAGLLGSGDRRSKALLALAEDELLAAVAGKRVEEGRAFLEALDIDRERERLAAAAVIAVCEHADAYPPLLHDLVDAPAVLFGVGRAEAMTLLAEEPVVTVVGTRRASPYGTEVAYALAEDLVRRASPSSAA